MPKKTPIINDFRAGELTPDMDARADLKDYYRGCRVLENAMPIIEGGVARVPGTYYVRPTKLTEEGWNIRVTKSGDGTGVVTSDVAGINCGADCYDFFMDGSTIVLTATPDGGSFEGWSGEGFSGTTPISVLMNGDKVINAEFSAMPAGLIAWYPVDEGSGTVITNIAPAGANKLPNLVLAAGSTFWSQVSGFGYWDGTTTLVRATWAAMFPFPTAAGTIILFAKEAYGVGDGAGKELFVLNLPMYAMHYYQGYYNFIQCQWGWGSTASDNTINKWPMANYYARPFVSVHRHDTVSTISLKMKYQNEGWVSNTAAPKSGFNHQNGVTGIFLGQYTDGTLKWKGTFGDFMVWNVELTDAEVDSVVNSLKGRWSM